MRAPPSRLWAAMTSPELTAWVAAEPGAIAVLPVGAIEQHGPHLPLAVDAVIADGVVAAATALMPDDLPAVVLPSQTVSYSREHEDFAGTLSLAPETFLKVVMDLGRNVAGAGIKKLVMLNGHGGNPPVLDVAARELRAAHGMLAVVASWYRLGLPEGLFPADEVRHGIHGGAVETAVMMHLAPGSVRQDKVADFASLTATLAADNEVLSATENVRFGWLAQDMNASGAAGDATKAATAGGADAGKAAIDHAAARLVHLLQEVDRFDGLADD